MNTYYSGEIVERATNGVPVTPVDHKVLACARIQDFVGMTVEGMLLKPYSEEGATGSVQPYNSIDAHHAVTDTRNRRLANALLGVEGAVRTLCQAEPPRERGEKIREERQIVDGTTGVARTHVFSAHRAGVDFGTVLSCEIDTPGIVDSRGDPTEELLLVLVPQDKHLVEVLHRGRPHEPGFYASETDTIGPEWSQKREERLENGGLASRQVNFGIRPAEATGEGNYRRGEIIYSPLYDPNAPGLEGYVRITQFLLRKLLDAAPKQVQ